jgi:hypothetical protein
LSGNIDEYEGTVYGFTGMGSIIGASIPRIFVQTVLV